MKTTLLPVVAKPYQRSLRSLAAPLDAAVGDSIRGQRLIALLVGGMVFIGLAIVGVSLAGI